MKKIILPVLAIGSAWVISGTAGHAEQGNDVLVRLNALEKENAAIRKENTALRENKTLRQHNAALKSSAAPQAAQAVPEAGTRRADPFGAYAADLPLAYKAPVAETRGQFRVWGEGGAIFSGGDPVAQDYTLTDFSLAYLGTNLGGSGIPSSFDLTPKIGWDAAAGFDYRFAGSPWHVSGQFRYGESGKTSRTASSAGTTDPQAYADFLGIPLPAVLAGANIGGSQTVGASYKENHWLADLAVGRDILGSGPSAMQVKGGLRIAEFIGTTGAFNNSNSYVNLVAPVPIFAGGPLIGSLTLDQASASNLRSSFLGAGPRIGIEGSVPFAGNWAFDYLGDAAVLFGNQKLVSTSTSTFVFGPPVYAALLGGNNSFSDRSTDQRFATVFNADIQVGVSYWMTQNVKLSASYRLDAYFNVLNQTFAATSQTTDRYIHGPRLGVSAQF